jgi:2Fe-2S ferredoxin
MEHAMVEAALQERPTARLSCQITLTEALDGLVVHVPQSQY